MRLCRYITRPAIANERLKRNRAGQVMLQLKSALRDCTTHVVMSPLEFMQRLAHAGAACALASDPFPWRARAPRQVACRDRSESTAEHQRAHSPSRAWRAGAHELGAASPARLRPRYRTLPALWRGLEDHRRHRRSGGDRQDPHASGLACARCAALPGAAAGFVPVGLILKSQTSSQQRFRNCADGTARPALTRSAQTASESVTSGRCRVRTMSATGKFSPNARAIDDPLDWGIEFLAVKEGV